MAIASGITSRVAMAIVTVTGPYSLVWTFKYGPKSSVRGSRICRIPHEFHIELREDGVN